MDGQLITPKIGFDEWTATPLTLRRLLLRLRSIAAGADKSLASFERNNRKEQERRPQFLEEVGRTINLFRDSAEAADSWLQANSVTSLPSPVNKILLDFHRLSAEADPIVRLLKTPNRDQTQPHSSPRSFLSSIRKTANYVEPLYTLLAKLDEDVAEAVGKYQELRNDLTRRLSDWGSPLPDYLADETQDRVIRRIEEGEEIRDLTHFSRAVAWRVWQEYLRKTADELPPDIPATCPSLEGLEDEEAHERRFTCMRMCLAKRSPETRWLISEYSHPDRKGKEKILHREKLAEMLGITRNQLTRRIHGIREELITCQNDCLRKKIPEPYKFVIRSLTARNGIFACRH